MIDRNNMCRLTLVIPTYERQDFVLRLMNFWADKGPNLIVLDGSSRPIEPAKLDTFGSQVQYLHRPVGLYQRLLEALDLVQTEFVALAGDDEFYLPSAVNECIKELDYDGGLIACCGLAVGYGLKNANVYGIKKYGRLMGYSIQSKSAKDRIKHHMSNYLPSLVYSISRTKPWKISWRNILTKEFAFYASGEIQFEICMAYAGRSKVLKHLMWIRAHNINKPIRGTDPSLDSKKRVVHWWKNKENKDQHIEFVAIMSAAFKELLPCEDNNRKSHVVAGLEEYIEFYKRAARGKLIKNTLSKLRLIINPANKNIDSLSDYQFQSLISVARKLETRGATVDYEALHEIIQLVN